MKIEVTKKYNNDELFDAELSGSIYKWFGNYNFTITGEGKDAEEAIETLKQIAKTMLEEINQVIYK